MTNTDTTRAATLAAPDRTQAVEQLYLKHFSFLRELIQADPHMNAETEQQIIEGVAKHLPAYSGHLTGKSFQAWLAEIVMPLVGFHAIRRVCQPFVRKAIWKGLGHAEEPSKYDDYPETLQELEQEVWLWVFLNLETLKQRGTAKLSTRLYERAKVMTRAWMKQQRTRRFAVIRRVYDLPSRAKMKAAAQNLAAEIDRERLQADLDKAEQKEIQDEMKKLALMA